METKHTPGPWHACHDGKCVCGMVWGEEDHIATVTRGDWGDTYPAIREGENGHLEPYIARESYGHVSVERAEANARLMAAAPDLLAALQLFVANSLRADWPADIYNAAEAAIAKAITPAAQESEP